MSQDDSESSSKEPPDLNPLTVLPSASLHLSGIQAIRLLDAYRHARDTLSGYPPKGEGYRLFWEDERATGWLDLHEFGSHAVIGRHSECDVVLSGPLELSLRHLVAMSVRYADGLAFRLLDLHTSIPFCGFDDSPHTSVVSFGPIAIRLAGAILGAIPLIKDRDRPGYFAVDPSDLTMTQFDDGNSLSISSDESATAAHPSTPAAVAQPLPATRGSRITSLPPPSALGETCRPNAIGVQPGHVSLQRRRPPEAQGVQRGSLSLQRAGRSVSVRVTAGELELGVLVGRSDRCINAGLQRLFGTSISRGHLLLLEQQGRIEAFDLASTQGTLQDGKRIRRLELLPGETRLQLSTSDPVFLTWEARESAIEPM